MPQTVEICVQPVAGVNAPLIFDCEGNVAPLPDGENLYVDGAPMVPLRRLTANETIYVDEGGDDDTGDGSSGAPYATLTRAAEHYTRIIPENFLVTVHLNPGTITQATRFQVVYPFGVSLVVEGESEVVAAPTVSSIDAAASTDGDFAGLRYYDFDLDLTGASDLAVGQFVVITTATGGTNPQVLNGLHRIESLAGDVATVRAWQAAGANAVLPSGAVTCTNVKVLKSVVKFEEDSQGIWINGIASMGEWNDVVIEGNVDAYAGSRAGLEPVGGGSIRSALGLYIHEWGRAVQPFAQGLAYLQAGAISKIKDIGINASQGGRVRATSFVINGCGSFAIQAASNAQVQAGSSKLHSMFNTACIADNNGFIDVASAQLHYPAVTAGGFGLFARDLSDIDCEGATVTGFGTTKSPATNPGNDESRIIGP